MLKYACSLCFVAAKIWDFQRKINWGWVTDRTQQKQKGQTEEGGCDRCTNLR